MKASTTAACRSARCRKRQYFMGPSLQSSIGSECGDERREDPGILWIQGEGKNDAVPEEETEILLGIQSLMAQIAEMTCRGHGGGLVFH